HNALHSERTIASFHHPTQPTDATGRSGGWRIASSLRETESRSGGIRRESTLQPRKKPRRRGVQRVGQLDLRQWHGSALLRDGTAAIFATQYRLDRAAAPRCATLNAWDRDDLRWRQKSAICPWDIERIRHRTARRPPIFHQCPFN